MKNDNDKKKLNYSQVLTSEQLEKKLSRNNCCGKEMILTETYEEKGNKVCSRYVCSQCHSDLFDYGERPKKSVTLTFQQYKSLLDEMKELSERQKKIYQILHQVK